MIFWKLKIGHFWRFSKMSIFERDLLTTLISQIFFISIKHLSCVGWSVKFSNWFVVSKKELNRRRSISHFIRGVEILHFQGSKKGSFLDIFKPSLIWGFGTPTAPYQKHGILESWWQGSLIAMRGYLTCLRFCDRS